MIECDLRDIVRAAGAGGPASGALQPSPERPGNGRRPYITVPAAAVDLPPVPGLGCRRDAGPRSSQKLVSEHWKAALGLLARGLVLNHIPMLREAYALLAYLLQCHHPVLNMISGCQLAIFHRE